jgi:hypothetical protein
VAVPDIGTLPIHGNYCGPGWTRGRRHPESDMYSIPYVAPVDQLDAACERHDRDCADGGCSSSGDRQLRNAALLVAATQPRLRAKALLIASAMDYASRRRDQ